MASATATLGSLLGGGNQKSSPRIVKIIHVDGNDHQHGGGGGYSHGGHGHDSGGHTINLIVPGETL